MTLSDMCIVDTNVPKTANLATHPDPNSDVPIACIVSCVKAIECVIRTKGLVLDDGAEIFDEYRQQLSMRGQPGMGDRFMKWVHDHQWSFPESQRVTINKNGDTYHEFPTHSGLEEFDKSDRKFVAVSNAHPDKPKILQATDSKWWGWKNALAEVGIRVEFICESHIQKKYREKMGT